jgi:hypothetical protein
VTSYLLPISVFARVQRIGSPDCARDSDQAPVPDQGQDHVSAPVHDRRQRGHKSERATLTDPDHDPDVEPSPEVDLDCSVHGRDPDLVIVRLSRRQ